MIYTFVIKVKDEPEPYRTKVGDILTVGDDKHTGGYSSRRVNLLVKVDFGDIALNDVKKLLIPQYDDKRLWYPSSDLIEDTGKMIAKRRYNISLTSLKTLAISKGIMIDWKNIKEQPLENAVFELLDFIGLVWDKAESRKMTIQQMITISNIGK